MNRYLLTLIALISSPLLLACRNSPAENGEPIREKRTFYGQTIEKTKNLSRDSENREEEQKKSFDNLAGE